MATATVNVASKFPEGTSVSAYTRGSQALTQDGPSGTAVATATVTAGSVTFTGLTEDERYVAYGYVGSAWVKQGFVVNNEVDPVYFRGTEIATKAQLDALEVDGTDITALEADVAVIGEMVTGLATNYTTDEASAIQTIINNVESQGGGRIIFPGTGPGDSGAIKIGSLIEVPQYVNIVGQGKWETEFKCSAAGAGFLWLGVGTTPEESRGGRSGGFRINGNQVANECMRTQAVNRNFEDIRLSNPKTAGGVALMCYAAQNNNFFGLEAEDSYHTASSTTKGIVFDAGTAGHNFYGLSLNEFTAGHVVFDASVAAPAALSTDHAQNININGFMIERSDTFSPIVHIKSGVGIHFSDGNLAIGTVAAVAEHPIVKIDNTAARSYSTIGGNGSPTMHISFRGTVLNGALGASHGSPATYRYSNCFEVASDCASWDSTLDVAADVKASNCFAMFKLDSTQLGVVGENLATHAGSGYVYLDNPAATGKANTQTRGSTGSITINPVCDFYSVTGNNTINNLSATYSGHKITLIFTGTPTVSSSAGNIKLSGLSDMSATADDLLCLIFDGTNWHETSRVVK